MFRHFSSSTAQVERLVHRVVRILDIAGEDRSAVGQRVRYEFCRFATAFVACDRVGVVDLELRTKPVHEINAAEPKIDAGIVTVLRLAEPGQEER